MRSLGSSTAGVQKLTVDGVDLESSGVLSDVGGLSHVPRLRSLSLNKCEKVSDLSALERVPELKRLDLEGCGGVSSVLPVLRHPALKTLKAWPELKRQFRHRAQVASAPSAAELRAAIAGARDATAAARALDHVASWVKLASTDTAHGLSTLFSSVAKGSADEHEHEHEHENENEHENEAEDQPRPHIDTAILDALVSRHAPKLEVSLCARVVTACLRHVGDELPFLTTLTERIVDEGDSAAARLVVKRFWDAEKDSDNGAWSPSTAAMARSFERCGASTQAEVLEPAGVSHLLPDSVRPLGHLLASATRAAKPGDGVEARVLEKVRWLVESYSDGLGPERIEAIVAPVRDAASPEGQQLLQACIDRIGRRDLARSAVEARDAKTINQLLARCGKELTGEEFADTAFLLGSGVFDRTQGLEEDSVLGFLEALLEEDEDLWPVRGPIGWLARRGPGAMSRTREVLAGHPEKAKFVGAQVRLMLKDAGPIELDPHAKVLFELANELEGLDPRLGLERDQERRLDDFLEQLAEPKAALAFAALLAQRERPFDLDRSDRDRVGRMVSGLASLVEHGQFESVSALFAVFDKLEGSKRSRQRLLRDFLAAACLAGDFTRADQVVAAIPGEVIVDGLAFNLACRGARTGNRDEVLNWARRAVELGKEQRAFLEEPDFEPFKGSPEFLAAIAGSA